MEHKRLPSWLVKPIAFSDNVHRLKKELRSRSLHTVCEEARCPNLGECWGRKTATLMILGDVCTRHCGFCAVSAGRPQEVDSEEPRKVAEIVSLLGLRHAVITCVARDDLADGGAGQFVRVIQTLRERKPDCTIEVLTTDFQMERGPMESICRAGPDIFNHNIETVERLSPWVRHRAGYRTSLEFLKRIKVFSPYLATKSGIMLGLGERREEVLEALRHLRDVGCEIVTMGQYLQPTSRNLEVIEYIKPEIFKEYETLGYGMGFKNVASGPFVRSSYHAEEMVNGI